MTLAEMPNKAEGDPLDRFDIDFDGITTCQNVTEAANAIHTMLSDYKAQDAENANRIRSNLTLSDADLSFATESELSM